LRDGTSETIDRPLSSIDQAITAARDLIAQRLTSCGRADVPVLQLTPLAVEGHLGWQLAADCDVFAVT
jgi:hypothetical protein